MLGALTAAALLAACARPTASLQPLSPIELSATVSGRTLYIAPPCCRAAPGTLLFLAKDGTGWIDRQVMPGDPPTTGTMSMVFRWDATAASQLRLWATPRIGDMPSFVPPYSECILLRRAPPPGRGLEATLARGNAVRTVPVFLYPADAFPPAVVDQYLTQVRALFGSRLPVWTAGGSILDRERPRPCG